LKNFKSLCFVVVFGACIGPSTEARVQQSTNSSPVDAGRRQDMYAVYAQIMSNPPTSFGNDMNTTYVIQAMTIAKAPKSPTPPDGVLAEFLAKFGQPCVEPPAQYQGRWNEILAEYNAGAPSIPLERLMNIAKPYVLVSNEGASTPIPGVRDFFRLTNVYFNRNRTLALAGVGSSCGTLCGHFEWLIFERTTGSGWQKVPLIKSCSIDN